MFDIEIKRSARKSLLNLPKSYQDKIIKVIDHFMEEPYPQGCKKLRKDNSLFAYRVGDYRIIYRVYQDELLVMVIDIAHRKDVYD